MRWNIFLPMFLVVLIILVLINVVSAYPIIVSEEGINHIRAKKLVFSIPEYYFLDVNKIIFTNKEFAKCKIIDIFGQKKCWKGWASAYWNKEHICTSAYIIIADLNKTRLIHETNHIYDYCVNKVDYSTEEFADKFRK